MMMLSAIFVLTTMGLLLGFTLGFAARKFHVESDPLLEEITEMMPGTQCGQCGYAGCSQAAEAIANQQVSVTCCPPGGKLLAENLAEKLGIKVDLDGLATEPLLARINPSLCTGCTRCFKACPTDAIVGANKQIHSVIMAACTGCKNCQDACPEDCIEMVSESQALGTWYWPKPAA